MLLVDDGLEGGKRGTEVLEMEQRIAHMLETTSATGLL